MALDDSAPIAGASNTEAPGLDITAPAAGTELDAELASLPRQNPVTRGVAAGYHGTLADFALAAEAVSGKIGMTGVRDWAAEKAAEQQEKAAENAPLVPTFEEAQKTGKYAQYIGGALGEQVFPMASLLPLMLLGGAGGVGLAARAGVGMTRSKAAQQLLMSRITGAAAPLTKAATKAAQLEQTIAGTAGSMAAIFPALYAQNLGADYGVQKSLGIDDFSAAMKSALPKTILNTIVPGQISGMLMRPGAEAVKRTIAGVANRILGVSAVGAAELGGVGYYNVKLTQMERAARDPSFDINSSEAEAERREAAIRGGMGGSVALALAGGVHAFKAPPKLPAPLPEQVANAPVEGAPPLATLAKQPPPQLLLPAPEPTISTAIPRFPGDALQVRIDRAEALAGKDRAGALAELPGMLQGLNDLRDYEKNQGLALMQRVEALNDEKPKSQGGERNMQDIMRDRKEVNAALEDLQQNPPSRGLFAKIKGVREKLGVAEQQLIPRKPVAEAVLSTDTQEAQNASQQGNFRQGTFGEYSNRNARGETAEAGDRDRLLGATRGAEEGGNAPSPAGNEARTQEVLTARAALVERTEQQVAGARERFSSPVAQGLLPAPPEMRLLTAPKEKISAAKQRVLDSGVAATNTHVDNLVQAGLLKKEQGTAAKRIINNAVKAGLQTGDVAKAKLTIEEGIKRALKGKVAAADMDTVVTDFYASLVETHNAKVGINIPKKGRMLSKAAGTKYYRGGGGSVSANGLTAEQIVNYETKTLGNKLEVTPGIDLSKIRGEDTAWVTKKAADAKEYGEVTSNRVGKHQILARDDQGGYLISAPKASRMFSKDSVTSPTGMIYFSHWGDVTSGMLNPKMIGTGVKGRDQEPAKTMGVAYTSAVVRGAHYLEPEVQSKPQSVGALRADRVFEARRDDPQLAAAFAKIKDQYGPDEALGWMQYLKDIHAEGKYDAILYGGGQLRLLTPQLVHPELDVVASLKQSDVLLKEHTGEFQGFTINLVTGQDMRGSNTFGVSPYKGREEIIRGEPTKDQIEEFIVRNSDLLALPDHSFGSWHRDGNTYLDVTVSIRDMRAALELGRAHEQLAIWDSKAGVEIPISHPLFDAAQIYNREANLPAMTPLSYIEPDARIMRQIAATYERLQVNNPAEHVQQAYGVFAAEVKQQFDTASKVIKIEPWTKEGQPYDDSAAMRADVFGNGHLFVFTGGEPHPLLTPEQNFQLRAIHDIFGHAKTGFEFGPRGELNAFRVHAQMFSDAAKPALASETLAQNAAFNYGAANEGKPVRERTFSIQKADLLPDELWRSLVAEGKNSRDSQLAYIDATFRAKGEEFLNRAEEILGTPEGLEYRPFVYVEGDINIGEFTPGKLKDVISWAVNAGKPTSLASHEGYHYLEERVMEEKQKAIMSDAFQPGKDLYERTLAEAVARDARNNTNIASDVREKPWEARAYGFQFWDEGKLAAPTWLGRIWDKIKEIGQRIKNLHDGMGFETAQDVFRAIDRGVYARRGRQAFRVEETADYNWFRDIEPDVFPSLKSGEPVSSQAKGRPYWVKGGGDVHRMRTRLSVLAQEGAAFKDWYRDSAAAIMDIYKGDATQAEKLAKLIAVFSPRTNVGEDLGYAMRAINQYRNDQPILAGRFPNKMSVKALEILTEKEGEGTVTGIKRNTFYRNMMMYIDPKNFNIESQGATVDMWISHMIGFNHDVNGKLNKSEYRYAEAEIGRLAQKMGWTIDQTQAAIWVSTKARWNMTRAMARDWGIKHSLFESMKEDDQRSLNFNEAGGGPPIKLKDDAASQRKFLEHWASLALNAKMDEGSLRKAGYNYANAIQDGRETGTIKPHTITFGEGLLHDNEIAADGDARQFTLRFYSKDALNDLALKAEDGNEATKQLYSLAGKLMSDAKLSEGQERSVLGDTVRGYTGGAIEGIKHFVDNISSGLQVFKNSSGGKNVFNLLSNFLARRNIIISEAIDGKLPSWRSHETTEEHRTNATKALNDRDDGNVANPDGFAADSEEYHQIVNSLSTHEQMMFREATDMIQSLLKSEFEIDKQNYAKVFKADVPKAVAYLRDKQAAPLDPVADAGTKAYAEWLENRGAQVDQLLKYGYIPKRRYGDHGVGITMDINGKAVTLGWEQFQLRGEAARYEAQLRETLKDYPELKVGYAFKYKAQYDGSISFKQFLDVARRFGVDLSQAERERVAKALISADSTARNRIFRRKGVPGYSQNGLRVLAEFATTMGHKIAYSEVGDALQDAMAGTAVDSKFRPDGSLEINTYAKTNLWNEDGELSGYYRNRADELVDFSTTPRQQSSVASFLRGAAAFNMLGASIASGFVNGLSLPMITIPYLSAHTGYVNALSKVFSSASYTVANFKALTDIKTLRDRTIALPGIDEVSGLREGLIVGALNGKLLDTELYQIMGLTRGGVLAQSKTVQAAMTKWMLPFRYAEQVNRYGTFIASWKIGLENGLRGDELTKFASDAVDKTQFRYDEVNRPAFARTPVGAVLMIFKSWPIFYLEALRGLYKVDKGAAATMLGSLALVSGVEGLPFAQDAENLIDTISQRLFGSPFNSARWARNMTKDFSEAVVGMDASGALMHGLANEFTSASIASRQSMGQLIPGSNIGRADADYKQVMSSVLGPAGSMVHGWLSGVNELNKGHYIEAVKKAAPLAGQNMAKAWQQFQTGYASNAAGQKLQDIGTLQPILQAAGFSSSAVSNSYEIDRIDRQTVAFYNQTKKDIIHDIVQGILHDKPDQVNDTFSLVVAWNKSHPDMPLVITGSTIRQQVLAAGLPMNERTLRKMPRALRGSSATYQELYGSRE